jgi:hypothetical protein
MTLPPLSSYNYAGSSSSGAFERQYGQQASQQAGQSVQQRKQSGSFGDIHRPSPGNANPSALSPATGGYNFDVQQSTSQLVSGAFGDKQQLECQCSRIGSGNIGPRHFHPATGALGLRIRLKPILAGTNSDDGVYQSPTYVSSGSAAGRAA